MKFTNYLLTSLKRSPYIVYKSQSVDVFQNIALEDFIYHNKQPEERVLFIWRNAPCIVIGRHQNTWLEVNVKDATQRNIPICRRHSGGGAVYHDLGNVNLTFFTHRENYKRTENLDFIIDVFQQHFDVALKRNNKDDLLLDNKYKVSGTAAKLGLNNAYHHFTLLCKTNLSNLHGLLKNPFGDFHTSATRSIQSKTKNIFPSEVDFDFDDIANVIGRKYYNYFNMKDSHITDIHPKDFAIQGKIDDLKTYEWTFAKSPRFVYNGQFESRNKENINYKLEVNKGIINTVEINENSEDISQLFKSLNDKSFKKEEIKDILSNNYEMKHKYLKAFINSLPF